MVTRDGELSVELLGYRTGIKLQNYFHDKMSFQTDGKIRKTKWFKGEIRIRTSVQVHRIEQGK